MTPPRCTLMLIPLLTAILATVGPLRAGCGDRSGASQTKLNISWLIVTDVAPDAATTGAGSKAVEAPEPADRPMMVYIPSDDPTDSITRKLEGVVFTNEKVAIAVTHLGPGERKVTYLMRAEQPGIFRVLPTRIWNMYRPGEGANGAGSSFEVTPAK